MLIIKLFGDDDVCHHIEHQKICFVWDNSFVFGEAVQGDFPDIKHGQIVVLACHIDNAVGDNRVCFGGV